MHSSPALEAKRTHLPVLDGLRGMAILLVMLYHFTGGTDHAASGLDRWFSRATGIGWCGVDLFFVLSGFLITGILFDSKRSPTAFRDFYARRSLRIFPLYYGVLLVLFVIVPRVLRIDVPGMDDVAPNQQWLWLYCGNIAKFLDPGVTFHSGMVQTVHFWSLAIEEQFYLVWPLLVLRLRPHTLVKLCVTVAAASLGVRVALAAEGVQGLYTFTPCRLEGLMVGAFLALAVRRGSGVNALAPAAKWVALMGGTTLLAVWSVVGLDNDHWTMTTFGFTLLALFFGAVLVLTLTQPASALWSRVLSSRGLRFFGKYSYGLYVFHYLLTPVFARFFSVDVLVERVFGHYWPARIASVALSFAASIVVAWLSWHLFEKHFLRLKDRFSSRSDERPLRVVVASSGLGHVSRGVEAWASDLGRALATRGVDVTLCKGAGQATESFERVVPCWTRESSRAKRVVALLPRAIAWRVGLGSVYGVEQATFSLGLLRVLRRERIDVLHVQDPLVASIVQRARRLGLVRTKVILAHGTEEPVEFLRRVEYVQHLAPWHAEECRSQSASKGSWTVVPNFVNTQRFSPASGEALRQELGVPSDAIVVLTVAAIKRRHKRIDALLDEFAHVVRSNPTLPLFLVIAGGQESDTAELIEHGKRLLGERVRFLVRFPRERMPDLYRCADVFVLASLKEMMPMAVLEALASGLPCIVNNHPVLEWMIGPGGLAIDMSKPGTLAAAVESLATDEARRRVIGAKARSHCVEQFGESVIVEQIVLYYGRISGRGATREASIIAKKAAESPAARSSSKSPTVSVVIPAYNSARWIEEAIESVLAQSVPPQDIIVVDDGSTDDTARRVAKFGNRVRYVHQENQGVAAARNAGIARSTGDWIAFLDADDVWHPLKLELQLRALAAHPEVGMLGTDTVDWPARFEARPASTSVVLRSWEELAVKNRFTTSSVMARRELLDRVGAFDVTLRGPEDYDLWLRVAEAAPVGVLESPLVGYRTVAQSLGRQARTMDAALGRVLGKVESRGAWRGRWFLRRKSYSYWRYSCAYMYLESGNPRTALQRLAQSMLLYPIPYRRDEVRMPLARLRMLSMMVRRMLRVSRRPAVSGVVRSA